MIEYIIKSFPKYDHTTGRRISDVPPKQIECARLRVDGELLQTAIEVDKKKNMRYYEKTTRYGKGFIDNDVLTSGLIGLIGEAAGALFFGVTTDWSYKKAGDGGYDFIVMGKRLDIKTAKDPSNHRNYIVRVEYKWRRKYEHLLKSIIYVGAYLENSQRIKEGYCNVVLVGYTSKRLLEKQPILKTPKQDSSHENTEMYFYDLSPIGVLWRQHERYRERHSSSDPSEI